jgi:Zn-dependent peptidase ImmA (M78 family)
MTLRRKHIRNLVDELLLKNKISKAEVPVEVIAKELGATVVKEATEDNLSGFLLRDIKKDRIIIGVNANHIGTRQRFTIAHEIGHLLLHNEETFHIDKKTEGFSVRLRNEESTKGTDRIEREANLFAAELLMPFEFIKKDMEEIGDIDLLHGDETIRLAKEYNVSNRALTYRLANLGYIEL